MKNIVKSIIEKELNRSIVLERPKDKRFGHFATPVAFSMAKELRKSPMVIAEELSQELSNLPQFSKVEAVKGYINFYLSDDFLNSEADKFVNSDEVVSEKREKILLEFVSANPTGPLHIGHARGAVYGDTLLRVGRALGYQIDSEYYINDAGRQIELLGLSIYYAGVTNILNREMEEPEEYYRGDYIVDLAREAYREFGEDIFTKEDISKLSDWGKDKMMEEIKSNLSSIGIEFDNFVSEKSLYSNWETALERIRERGGAYEKDGKIWLKSTQFGDEKDRVVVRDNGMPTYLAGDIIYHMDKFERGYDRYINIWGADHHGYIKRVQSAIEFLGFDSKKLEILLTQMVALLKDGEPYKMSKRAGNFILMRDVVDEVGSDALRFIFASKRPDISLEFDISDLSKQDSSNPIYYINYAHARIHSLFSKSQYSKDEILAVQFSNLGEREKDLLFNSLRLLDILEETFNSRETQKLTDYLYSLASDFHSFYNTTPIIETPNEKLLLKLSWVVASSIRKGLRLLGIEAKERM